jgi:sortase A
MLIDRTPSRTPKGSPQVRPVEPRVRGVWLLAERVSWAFGLTALALWAAANLAGIAGAREDLKRFEALRVGSQGTQSLSDTPAPDLGLWDLERVQAWRTALTQPAPAPLALLRIPKIRLEAAVLPGTDDFVLNRALGHIEDTALPGMDGNSGIAGHRDGLFRGLKDMAPGDAIELETREGRRLYHVERTWIVNPEDVSVLDATRTRSLTLVTCYPFFHVGPAPQRYIVRAVSAESGTLRVPLSP